MRSLRKFRVAGLLLIWFQFSHAQYTVNGNAQQVSCNQYRLTQEATFLTGSVWNNNKIDLSQSFDFKFDVFLGSLNSPGADGIAFVLQPISTSVGSAGSGLGYEGITPAVGITLDTYQNTSPDNDPAFDHIAIQLNGDLNHLSANNIAGPVQAISGNDNIEDGQWHAFRITWNAASKTITAYIDGVQRVTATQDFVTTVLGGNPMVFWGFTGSTGGEYNLQQFKTALNPSFHLAPNQKRCVGEPINFFDSTVSFTNIAKFYWDFGDGSPIDSVNINPVHTYTTHGDFTVSLLVIGADGCTANFAQVIRVGTKPVSAIRLAANFSNCIGQNNQFYDSSYLVHGTINSWYWDFGDGITSAAQNPLITYLNYGYKNVRLAVSTLEGCQSDTTVRVIVKRLPVVDFDFTDSVCLGQPTFFHDLSTVLPDGSIGGWNWNMEGNILNTQNPVYTFTTPGLHPVTLVAGPGNDCVRVKTKNVFVVDKPHPAVKDQFICSQASVTLQDSSYVTDGFPIVAWWWDLGNGQFSTQQNPTVTYTTYGPVTIRLVVTNSRGCISDTLSKTMQVEANAIAKFGYSSPLCSNIPVQFSDSSLVPGGTVTQWTWVENGAVFSNTRNPVQLFPAGIHTIGLVASNVAGCKSDTLFKTFEVYPKPVIAMQFNNACNSIPVNFTGSSVAGITITDWRWNFGDGSSANGLQAQHAYAGEGIYNVTLSAVSAQGCPSGTINRNIIIYSTHAFAGNDTIAAAGQPVPLHATGGVHYSWSPATGLNDANSANPVAILQSTQTFIVKAYTDRGCESYDDVTVKIYKGPDIYLPNAFSPNNDGLNDLYRGIPVGIDRFGFMKIYNRWGQLLFYSTDHRKGWDGNLKGVRQETGTYVVIVSGTDFLGHVISKRQSFLLIR